ncbi:hypothetical protein SVAN01_09240 [Stagonosporopsis vannaccii]|nr:hypothetical protein SVAN01_09240 [Stagonosporopsis vannaccii]
MAGQKRTRTGEPKPASKSQSQQQEDIAMIDTPPCGQAQSPPPAAQPKPPRIKAAPWNTFNPAIHGAPKVPEGNNTTSHAEAVEKDNAARRKYYERKKAAKAANNKSATDTSNSTKTEAGGIQKRPLLPSNATLTKRPLLHPALPSPFSASSNPKILYITASSPFIPACKRIRSLLSQIAKRGAQAESAASGRGKHGAHRGGKRALEANGHLTPQDVEASIASAATTMSHLQGRGRGRGRGKESVGGEEVYLKATGRAIPRALELGVKFQGEEDCRVRVEMGNVKAIDDVEVRLRPQDGKDGLEGGEKEGEGGGDVEEVPETRIRTLSTVTVCIGLI